MSKAIATILRAGGFTSITFPSAEAALRADATMTADCLVLDIMLPGMSGFDLYRRLVACGALTPAIFITARDEPPIREEAARTGPNNRYLPKPFSGRNLLEAVAQSLASQPGLRSGGQQ